jgi:hypothetical protein
MRRVLIPGRKRPASKPLPRLIPSPLGPVSGDIINIGFIFTLLQLMLWSLVEGIIEALSAWALWLTPIRAIISGLAVAIALWLWT